MFIIIKNNIFLGCNVGIGKITALELAKLGAKIIMGCRNQQSGEEAKQSIITDSKNDNIILKKLDLSSFESVRAFANEVMQEEERIDILVNNAGVMALPFGLTVDGFEKQFAINHLGHFLLTNLLLDLLKKSDAARVVVVASKMAKISTTNFDDINYENNRYSPYPAYARSKLANILFVSELSRRMEGTNVTTYSVHPGVVKTELYRDQRAITKAFMWPARFFMKTPEQGAATTLYCALEQGIEENSGRYFAGKKVESLPVKYTDKELAAKLWEMSEKMTKLQ